LEPGPGARVEWARTKCADDYTTGAAWQGDVGLARAAALMRDQGRDLHVFDLTQPGDTLSSVRVAVTGLAHFDPGRLYRLVE